MRGEKSKSKEGEKNVDWKKSLVMSNMYILIKNYAKLLLKTKYKNMIKRKDIKY